MIDDVTEESTLANRHVSRFIAIMSVYSSEIKEIENLSKVAKGLSHAYLNKDIFDFNEEDKGLMSLHHPDELFLEQLLTLYQEKKSSCEDLIKDNLIEKYKLNKLDRVIKSILCLASLELLYYEQTPAKIIIDEYVSLTKAFYGNNEAGFVNKVIDVLARKTRQENEF